MANEEQLKIIKQGVYHWNDWRNKNPMENVDLQGANLIGAVLGGANLSRADLDGAKMADARCMEANFQDASLEEANLIGCVLNRADLCRAKCRKADFSKATLHSANLTTTDLSSAKLTGVMFNRANFHETSLSSANFKEALFHGTLFRDVNLSNAIELEHCLHSGPSSVDQRTLELSKNVPINFWRGCGLPEALIDYLPSLLNQAIQFYSCFISYSHADKSFARRLHNDLQAQGIRCWLDEHQMRGGDDIYEQVDRGIRLWDKTILGLSQQRYVERHSIRPDF